MRIIIKLFFYFLLNFYARFVEQALKSKGLNDYKLYIHDTQRDPNNIPAELIPTLQNQGGKSKRRYMFMCKPFFSPALLDLYSQTLRGYDLKYKNTLGKRNETQVCAGPLESMTPFLNNLKSPAKGPSKLSDIPSSSEPTW